MRVYTQIGVQIPDRTPPVFRVRPFRKEGFELAVRLRPVLRTLIIQQNIIPHQHSFSAFIKTVFRLKGGSIEGICPGQGHWDGITTYLRPGERPRA